MNLIISLFTYAVLINGKLDLITTDEGDAWAHVDYLVRTTPFAHRQDIELLSSNVEDQRLFPRDTDGVLAWVGEGERFCAEHGAVLVADPDSDPILKDNGADLAIVEWCASTCETSDHGHSFCGECGDYLYPEGHHDSTMVGPFSFCQNCASWGVYVEGRGWQYVEDINDIGDNLTLTVKGRVEWTGSAHALTVREGWEKIDVTSVDRGVLDALPYRWSARSGIKAYLAYLDLDPSAGEVLVLASTWDTAFDDAQLMFNDLNTDPHVSEDDHETFVRESLTLVEVPFEDISFDVI